VATSQAGGVRTQAGASYGVGITGYAGPTGGTPKDPVGTFYCAIASAEGAQVQRGRVEGDRERVRQFAAYRALEMLWRAVQGAA
ncbi:MAG: CinA family protein, partial [Myxococcaceae bacterium]